MGLKQFTLGFLLAVSISACGTFKFIYKYYVYDYEAQVLRGPDPKDDIESKVCSLVNGEYQCVVMKVDEFYRLKADHLKHLQKIEELQRACRN